MLNYLYLGTTPNIPLIWISDELQVTNAMLISTWGNEKLLVTWLLETKVQLIYNLRKCQIVTTKHDTLLLKDY